MALGGASVVARMIGTRRSHVANVLGGKRPLGRETAQRLRTVIALDADTWLELLAPAPDQQPEASEATS